VTTWARTASGDLLFPTLGSGQSALVTDPGAQCAITLQDKLSFWLGEWFLDTSQGVPWLQVLGIKNPNVSAIRAMLRSIIEGTPPVVSVNELSAVFTPARRSFAYQFSATLASGQVLTGGTGQPFIVSAGS